MEHGYPYIERVLLTRDDYSSLRSPEFDFNVNIIFTFFACALSFFLSFFLFFPFFLSFSRLFPPFHTSYSHTLFTHTHKRSLFLIVYVCCVYVCVCVCVCVCVLALMWVDVFTVTRRRTRGRTLCKIDDTGEGTGWRRNAKQGFRLLVGITFLSRALDQTWLEERERNADTRDYFTRDRKRGSLGALGSRTRFPDPSAGFPFPNFVSNPPLD